MHNITFLCIFFEKRMFNFYVLSKTSVQYTLFMHFQVGFIWMEQKAVQKLVYCVYTRETIVSKIFGGGGREKKFLILAAAERKVL